MNETIEDPIYVPNGSISPVIVDAVNIASPARAWNQFDLNALAVRDHLYKRSQWLGINTPYYKDPEQVYNEVLQQTGDVSQAEKAKQDAITGNTNIDTNLKNWAAAKQYAISATTPTEGIRDPGLNAMAVPLYGALGVASLPVTGPIIGSAIPTSWSWLVGLGTGILGSHYGGKSADWIIQQTTGYDGWKDMATDWTKDWKYDPYLHHWDKIVVNAGNPGEWLGGFAGGFAGEIGSSMLADDVAKIWPKIVSAGKAFSRGYNRGVQRFNTQIATQPSSHTIHLSEKPIVNTDGSNTIAYEDIHNSITKFDNFVKHHNSTVSLSTEEKNAVRRFRRWLNKNSIINSKAYTNEQLAYALRHRKNRLLNQSNNNFVSIVDPLDDIVITTYQNENPIGAIELFDNVDNLGISMIEKTNPMQKLTIPYTILGLDASINYAQQIGKNGVESGAVLLSPQYTLKHTTPYNYNYSIPIYNNGQPKMGQYSSVHNYIPDEIVDGNGSDLIFNDTKSRTAVSLTPSKRLELEQLMNQNGVVYYSTHPIYDLNNYPGYKYFSPIKVLHSYPQRPFQHNVKSTFFDPMKIKYDENGEMLIDWDNTDLFYKCGGKLNKNKKRGYYPSLNTNT